MLRLSLSKEDEETALFKSSCKEKRSRQLAQEISVNIITVTHERRLINEPATYARIQSRAPSAAGCSKPTTPNRIQQAFPRRGFFRRSRPGAGQVRNAPLSRVRRQVGDRECGRLWIFSPGLLPHPSRLQSRRTPWPSASQERPTGTAQAHPRTDYLSRAMPKRGPGIGLCCSGFTGPPEISDSPTSSNNRACSFRKKNSSPLNRPTAIEALPEKGWSNRYEALRQKALTRARGRRCTLGVGLSLVLNQGVMSWMSAWRPTRDSDSLAPAPSESLEPPPPFPPHLKGQLSQVMAAILLQACRGAL